MTEPVTLPVESVRRRYLVTVFTQFIQFAASLATAGVVPRALGPAAFGNYNFLLTTAATLRGFVEPSVQQAFFTFSSQERRSGALTKFYTVVLFAQVIITFAFIGIVALLGKLDWLWTGQALDQILLVTVLEWLVFIAASLQQLGDSKGLTVRAQLLSLITSLINLVGLLGLHAFGLLNLYTYIAINMVSAVLIGMALVYWLLIRNADLTWAGTLKSGIGEYVRRWWRFAAPLILLEYYSPLVAYLGTYLLQRWYGSVEQGYFALSLKWSAFVLVFTSSAMNIFWREIASAIAVGDRERAARTYLRFTHLLFFLALVLCTWLSFSSRSLIQILAGEDFILAVPVLIIMAYYPLQQTYGQINTAALKGAERTQLVRNFGIVVFTIDLFLNYVLLASPTAPVPGLGLGAIGVAIRMVVFGLLYAQIYEWLSHRVFGLSLFETLMKKLLAVSVVMPLGMCILIWGADLLEPLGMVNIFVFGITSCVYFAIMGMIILTWPGLLGFSRSELWDTFHAIRTWLFKILGVSKTV